MPTPTPANLNAHLDALGSRPLYGRVRVDLSRVSQLPADTLVRLVYLDRRAREEGGRLVLTNVEPGLSLLLALAGFGNRLAVRAKVAA